MKRDTLISNSASRFIDAKYHLGDPSQGWDCLNSILSFYGDFGYQFPEEIDGWTRENYAEKWNRDEKEGRRVLRKFLTSVGDPVPGNFPFRGDLVLFESEEIPMFPGIYLGSMTILVNWGKDIGLRVVAFPIPHVPVVGVRRLIK